MYNSMESPNNIISKSNIISEKDFKDRVMAIFKLVADAVSKTLGPFGKTTIIEQFGEMHVTKDGWTVLKGITFEDNTDNNILYLLTKIASQVVVKVGDGSTSSIVAADEVLKLFSESNIVDIDFGPREFTETLNRLVIKLVDAIERKSIKINDEDFNEERDKKIYNLAMISTNGNHTISEMISKIYSETGNSSISFVKGSYAEHEVEIVNGYKSNIRLLDGIYISNESGIRTESQPMILMFDHRLELEHYMNMIVPVRAQCAATGHILYVVAPHYSDAALQRIKSDTNLFFKASQGKFQDVYCRSSIISNFSRQLYSDLACLLGATVIDTTKVEEFIKEEDETVRIQSIIDCLGTCGAVSIDIKDALFSDFIAKDEKLFEVVMADAVSRYNEAKERFARLDTVSPELVDIKTRIAKLKCKMGIIKVGGVSTLEQSANYDLVDDAVKACENAFIYGYNIGCSLIIPTTITELIAQNSFTDKEIQILNMLGLAFLNVYKRVIQNKYVQVEKPEEQKLLSEKIDSIISGSIENQLPFDLTTNTYSTKIINPTHTDIEILKATSSMVSLLITSNQYLKIQLPTQR